MKKQLLTLISAFVAFTASAQVDYISDCSFADNFTDAAVPGTAPLQILWWGDTSFYKQTRSGNGSLDVIVNQPENGWTPMGLDLGETTNYVDISQDQRAEVQLTNQGSSDIEIYFNFISGRTAATSPGGAKMVNGDVLGSTFGGVVLAGQTKSWNFDLNGAKKRTWVADQAACDAIGGTLLGSSCLTDAGFDPSELSTIEFSINGAGTSINGFWTQPELVDNLVSIDYIRAGGNCNAPSSCDPASINNSIIIDGNITKETKQYIDDTLELNNSADTLAGFTRQVSWERSVNGGAWEAISASSLFDLSSDGKLLYLTGSALAADGDYQDIRSTVEHVDNGVVGCSSTSSTVRITRGYRDLNALEISNSSLSQNIPIGGISPLTAVVSHDGNGDHRFQWEINIDGQGWKNLTGETGIVVSGDTVSVTDLPVEQIGEAVQIRAVASLFENGIEQSWKDTSEVATFTLSYDGSATSLKYNSNSFSLVQTYYTGDPTHLQFFYNSDGYDSVLVQWETQLNNGSWMALDSTSSISVSDDVVEVFTLPMIAEYETQGFRAKLKVIRNGIILDWEDISQEFYLFKFSNCAKRSTIEICAVSVGDHGFNTVYWSKLNRSDVANYIVYKETNVTGVWDTLGLVSSTTSELIDSSSTPNAVSANYLLMYTDTCGNQSSSIAHKTIHLSSNRGINGEINLNWTAYEGFDYDNFAIYRGSSADNLSLLTQVQSTIFNYSDLNPPGGALYYQIGVSRPGGCSPTSRTTDATGNALSNKENINGSDGVPGLNGSHLNVYPNPTDNVLNLPAESLTYLVSDILGVTVATGTGNVANVENLKVGTYFITIITAEGQGTTRFIKK